MNEIIVPGRSMPAKSAIHPQDVGRLMGIFLQAAPIVRDVGKWQVAANCDWAEFASPFGDPKEETEARQAIRARRQGGRRKFRTKPGGL